MARRKVIFSNHALLRIKERFIPKAIVIEAIRNPDRIEKSSKISLRVLIKKLYFNEYFQKEHLLMIICEVGLKQIEVITIIDTSKISKYF